jgi:hypothetical protein
MRGKKGGGGGGGRNTVRPTEHSVELEICFSTNYFSFSLSYATEKLSGWQMWRDAVPGAMVYGSAKGTVNAFPSHARHALYEEGEEQ